MPVRPHAGPVIFRRQEPADEPLVRRAHVEHRRSLLAGVPWPADAMMRLCEGQHELQERHIAAHHPHAEMLMIEVDGSRVGRLCLDPTAPPWRIVDVVLIPEAQGRGIGGAAIRRVLDDAAMAGAAVELQVALDNPRAETLYRRLGFRNAIGSSSTHRRLIWSPS